MPFAVVPPVPQRGEEGEEPEQRAREVYPDGVLHTAHAGVALGILADVHLAEDAEERDPQDEEHEVPGPDEPEAQDEGHQVQHGRERRQAADDLGVHPLRVGVHARVVRALQVVAVEPAHGQREGELHDVHGREGDVGECEAEETHLVWGVGPGGEAWLPRASVCVWSLIGCGFVRVASSLGCFEYRYSWFVGVRAPVIYCPQAESIVWGFVPLRHSLGVFRGGGRCHRFVATTNDRQIE